MVVEATLIRLQRTEPGDFNALRVLFDDPSFFDWGGSGRLSDELIREKYLGGRYPDVECFLVLLDQRAIGLAQLHAEADGGGADLILMPESRGCGIGRTVVANLAHSARVERGWSRLTVDPELQNKPGIAFWQAVGFTPERVAADVPGKSSYLLMAMPLE